MKYSIGVDIGGSHISCAVIDLERIEIIRETLTEMPVNNKGKAREDAVLIGSACLLDTEFWHAVKGSL